MSTKVLQLTGDRPRGTGTVGGGFVEVGRHPAGALILQGYLDTSMADFG